MRRRPAPCRRWNFNPRSPHGERHQGRVHRHGKDCISTHAPRTGSDIEDASIGTAKIAFQPTLPARGATSPFAIRESIDSISTHAPRTGSDVRGLTPVLCGGRISTHAPRTGSDAEIILGCAYNVDFNPRSPHGERLACARVRARAVVISTHAPRTGSDITPEGHFLRYGISTHAPRTGSDHWQEPNRLLTLEISTHAPRTGSDLSGTICKIRYIISTHAPRTGSDGSKLLQVQTEGNISTHAPRTGSDQSCRPRPNRRREISTHAPRTGSD